ncbi:MAG TPA: hypothetical protein PKE31_21230 [Pseudomonadota bacterium]|nr:hypothetical protein [Pseudomonadota bacterium]
MSTFNIEIDATQLFFRKFYIPSHGHVFDARTVQTVALAKGSYNIQWASGYFADFVFQVTAEGTVDYDPSCDGFLQGRGTSRLSMPGLEVTLDAQYIALQQPFGVLLVGEFTNDDWIVKKTVRLLPASHYLVQQGSGLVSSFEFKLGFDGCFQYNAAYDASTGGFLAGAGTSTLTFLGYPVLLDGTRVNGMGVHFGNCWGLKFASNGVQFAHLLPMGTPYFVQVESGGLTDAGVHVGLDGTLECVTSGTYVLRRDTFHGLARLGIRKH